MSTILSLLALLVGATAVSAIGTRISLYFHRQDVLEVHPHMARRAQAFPSETQIPLECSGTWSLADSISASTRYARIGLGVIACLLSGMVL